MGYQLGEVRAVMCREPRAFMLDNQALALEADIPVARLAPEIVDAQDWPSLAAGAWRF